MALSDTSLKPVLPIRSSSQQNRYKNREMSAGFLTSSYLQYKADTDAVAKWLVATARACGFPVDTLGGATMTTTTGRGSTPAQSSKRLKGKARKLAREGASAPAPTQTTNPQSAKRKNVIALREFVNLADYIAASTEPAVSVPATFIAVLERAISVRRDHGVQAETKRSPGAQSQKSSDRHNYFIGILEHVQRALRPYMSSDNVKDPLTQPLDDSSVKNKVGNLANRFEGLDVQEPSEAFLQAPDVPMPLPTDDKAELDYEVEQPRDFEEAYFAFCLLLQDLREMQAVIKQTWEGYQLGMFDLVSASLMTNCAIDFARHMEEEIQQLLNEHGGVMTILGQAYTAMCAIEGEDSEARQQPGDPVNFRTYNIAESMFLPTFTLIYSFCDIVDKRDKRQVLPYKAGYFGTFDRASDRSKKSARGRFQEDKLVMLEILSEFLFLHRLVPSPKPHEDEITRGLRQMFDTHKVPLWLTFGCQIFLDIHHALRDNVEKGFHDAKISAKVIADSIKLNMDFHSKLRIGNWPKSNDTAFEILLDHITSWVDLDFTQSIKERHRVWNPSESFKLLKWHPLLCGIWTYNLKARYQDLAITFQEAWGSIMYSAHLYNALRQEKLLSKQWADLDLVLSWHEEIFVGEPPQNPEDYLKRYILGVGYSAASFARNRRQTGRLPESKTGPKSIQPAAPVSRMFFDRHVQGSGRIGFSESDFEQIVASGVWQNDDENQKEEGIISMQRSATNKRRNPATKDSLSRKFTIVGLLGAMRNTLQAEVLEFSFDYLAVHRNCWKMLRAVREACDPMLRKIHGPEYIENESQLPFVVGYIFMAATGTDQLGKVLANKDEVVKSQIMVTAGRVVESLMETPLGRVAVESLAEQGYHIDSGVKEGYSVRY
ncbi:hypothetical protein BDV12DRAFT_172098 [Aspergillus spectabilis]